MNYGELLIFCGKTRAFADVSAADTNVSPYAVAVIYDYYAYYVASLDHVGC